MFRINVHFVQWHLHSIVTNFILLKAQRTLYQYAKDKPNRNITQPTLFQCKKSDKTTQKVVTPVFHISTPLKYKSNFWRTLEMPLLSYKIVRYFVKFLIAR